MEIYHGNFLINDDSIIGSRYPENLITSKKNKLYLIIEDTIYKNIAVSRHSYDIDISNLGAINENELNEFPLYNNLFLRTEFNSYFENEKFNFNLSYSNKKTNSKKIHTIYIEKIENDEIIKLRIYLKANRDNEHISIKSNLIYPRECFKNILPQSKEFELEDIDIFQTISNFSAITSQSLIPIDNRTFIGKKENPFFAGMFGNVLKIPFLNDINAKKYIDEAGRPQCCLFMSSDHHQLLIFYNNAFKDMNANTIVDNVFEN